LVLQKVLQVLGQKAPGQFLSSLSSYHDLLILGARFNICMMEEHITRIHADLDHSVKIAYTKVKIKKSFNVDDLFILKLS
jgi:hypothetical protein